MKTLPISKTEYAFRNIKETIKVKETRPKLSGYEFDEKFIKTERDKLYQERVTILLASPDNFKDSPQIQAEFKQRLEQEFEAFFENYIKQNEFMFLKKDLTGNPIPIFNGEEEIEVEKEIYKDGVIDVEEADLRLIGKTKKFEKDSAGVWQVADMSAAELMLIRQKEQEQLRDSYPQIVESLIRERYTLSQELAVLRQRDTKADEFKSFNLYTEQCKLRAKEKAGLI